MLPIEFKSVQFQRGQFSLDLSLHIPGGGISVILGPSGCGKTTVLDLCAGFIHAQSGRIYHGQKDISLLAPEERNIGVVFQDHALFPHMSVLGNVAFGPRMRGKSRAEARKMAREKLELVGLGELEQRRPASLSGGERQRVSVARALATNPSLLLLDEPFSSLDLFLRKNLGREVRNIIDNTGVTAILVTHDQEEALCLADHLAVMNKGRIIRAGNPMDVWSDPKDAFTASFLGRHTWLEIHNISGDREDAEGKRVLIQTAAGSISMVRPDAEIHLPAALMLRSESLRISREGILRASIIRMQYTGSTWQIELQPPAGSMKDSIAADWNSKDPPPQIGEVLRFDVEQEGIRIIEV